MSITFNDICTLLEKVERISTRHPRFPPKNETASIQQIVSSWFSHHRQAIDNTGTNGGAVLSAIFPHKRKDRVYGLQPTSLSRKITKLLGFNHGQRALFDKWTHGAHGDLGAYTEMAMKPWDGTFKTKRFILIEKVDRLLVQLAAKYRFSDRALREQRDWHMSTDTELKDILVRLESWEAKWLVRLLLRDYCTIELEEKFVLGQYHFLLPDLLVFQNDFDAVFSLLRGELNCYPPVPDPSSERLMRIEAAKKLRAVVGVKIGRPTFYKAWSFKHCFQLVGNRAWAAEVKYDGEYCEIHVNLDSPLNNIQIFSKNGKDATADRHALHRDRSTIRNALRVGQPDCMFERKCIVLGELVLYSDKQKRILPFSKIRKHISRSGSFMGTLQDSLPHEWEHLMIVFFDVLVLDDKPILRQSLQERRRILRDLVQIIPGRSMRSEWTLLDFKTEDGITDLKQAFARTLAHREEGLVLKPLHAPYFPLFSELGQRQPGFFIKVKKDYLGDMGGERDLGDFAIVGASYDAQVSAKTDIRPLHWTHFHLGCLTNRSAVQRNGTKPKFKIVGCLSLDKCIPKPEFRYLNVHGYMYNTPLRQDGSIENFDIEHNKYDRRMSVAFRKPFVAEILGGGYQTVPNEDFEMLRHPRIKKIHHDRTWEDTVCIEDLKRMAEEKWEVPEAGKLDGHAKDVALLVKKYVTEMNSSQITNTEYDTTQETTQRTSPRTTQESAQETPDDAVVRETQQSATQSTWATTPTTQFSGSTQGLGIKASKQLRVLEDTVEWAAVSRITQPVQQAAILPTPPESFPDEVPSTSKKRRINEGLVVSPPQMKRMKIRSPLKDAETNRDLGAFDYDSQEKIIHIYAEEGWKVKIHTGSEQRK